MLAKLISASIRLRWLVLGFFIVLLGAGVWAGKSLPIDAMPDTTTVQVDIITPAAGLSAVEVERTVSFPIENGMNGLPHSLQLRSVSRFGLSAVTVVFE